MLALHGLAGWALLHSMGTTWVSRPAAEPVMTWLSFPARPVATTPARVAAPPAKPAPVRGAPIAVAPLITPPPPQGPSITTAPAAAPPIDWQAAASQGARDALREQRANARRDRSMGQAPVPPPVVRAPHEAFPWGHQPAGKHYDRQGAIVTLRTRRCAVALLLVVPAGFACNPGRIDEEPGRADLFDERHRAQPLELPAERDNDPDALPK